MREDTELGFGVSDEDRLGPIILHCRPRSFIDFAAQQGFSPIEYYCLQAVGLVGLVILALIFSAPVVLLITKDIDHISSWVIHFVLSGLIFIGLIWVTLLYPRSDYCHLHERGFRYRVWWQWGTVALGDLSEFRIGRDLSFVEQMGKFSAKLHSFGTDRTWEQNQEKSLTLTQKNGKTRIIENFLIRFESADTLIFLQHVDLHCQRILVVRS